jgi:cephalosporin hydroxylase
MPPQLSHPEDRGGVAPAQALLATLPGCAGPVDVYSDDGFRLLSQLWTKAGWQRKLSYELTWLGVPIIQIPEDILMMQELLYKVRPRVVVETGVAHGGSAIFYASMLELIGRGRVVGVDIEIRKYNRLAIQSHPMSDRITLVEGSSVEPAIVRQVQNAIAGDEPVLVTLDSSHTRDHVRRELELYSPFVAPGSYVVVFDTVMDLVSDTPSGQPDWRETGAGAAVREFLRDHPEFEVDPYYTRLGATYMEGGVLRRKQYASTMEPSTDSLDGS